MVTDCKKGVIDASTSEAYVYGATLLIGSGCGAFFSAGFSVIQNLLPVAELSDAISFLSIGIHTCTHSKQKAVLTSEQANRWVSL